MFVQKKYNILNLLSFGDNKISKRANNFTFFKHIACRLDQNICDIMAVATIKWIIKVQNTRNDHADKYVYSSCSPYFLPNLENTCLCAAETGSVLKRYFQLWTWDTALHCLHGLLETANMGPEINIHHLQAAYTSCVKLDLYFPQDVLSTVFDRSVGCMHSKHILHLIKAHLYTHTP